MISILLPAYKVETIAILNKILNKKNKPITIIVGGSKVSTKISLLENLIKIADNLVIGGAMANTFLFSKGLNMGNSLLEKELVSSAKRILDEANHYNTNVILPLDVVCSNELKHIKNIDVKKILSNHMALDIGNKTLELIESIILIPKQLIFPFSSHSPWRILILGLPTNSATLIFEGLL